MNTTYNIHFIEVPEEETEYLFEKIIAKKFPNLRKEPHPDPGGT